MAGKATPKFAEARTAHGFIPSLSIPPRSRGVEQRKDATLPEHLRVGQQSAVDGRDHTRAHVTVPPEPSEESPRTYGNTCMDRNVMTPEGSATRAFNRRRHGTMPAGRVG